MNADLGRVSSLEGAHQDNSSENLVSLQGFRIEAVGKVFFQVLAAALSLLSGGTLVASVLVSLPLSVVIVSAVALGVLFAISLIVWVKPFLPKPVLAVVNLIQATALDVLATLACVFSYPILQTWFDPKEVEKKEETPVLLIHGYLHNSSAWGYHRYHYKNVGMQSVFTVDLGHPLHSIEDYGRVVSDRIKEIQAVTGKSQIKLVGHSMGGVVASYYATSLAKQDDIEVLDLITLGSPLQGTGIAVIGIGECAKQMQRGSPFLTQLSQDLENSDLSRFHLGSTVDLIVWPHSTSLNGEEEGENNLLYKNIGHASFLFSDNVIKRVVTRLLSTGV